jgi:hypothetical protein
MNHTRRGCRPIRTHFGEHFHALGNQLARRVLQRDYSERWRPTAGAVVATESASVNANCDNGVGALQRVPRRGQHGGAAAYRVARTRLVRGTQRGSQVPFSAPAPLPSRCAQRAYQDFRAWDSSLFDRGRRCTSSVILAVRTARNVVVVADHRRAAHVPSHFVFRGHTAHLGQP